MQKNMLKVSYKIYFDAEDISQSRILSTTSYVKNLLSQSDNSYIKQIQIDNESDLDDFILRIYMDGGFEEVCCEEEDAKMLAPELAAILSEIAQAHSYLDMEGSFTVSYNGKTEAYRFVSESGDTYCDFIPLLIS